MTKKTTEGSSKNKRRGRSSSQRKVRSKVLAAYRNSEEKLRKLYENVSK